MKLLFLAAALLSSTASGAASFPPGALVSAAPLADAPEGTRAFRIVYRTTTGDTRSAQASGIVIVPAGAAPRGGRNTVAWAHGTTGIADACAPSANTWKYSIIADLSPLLQHGYIVVAPDYIGLGTPGTHPFLVGEETAHAVLDAVRASRALPHIGSNGRFAVWGESQGGHAALWSGQRARAYAPELRLVGVAAAAPATDLVANIAGSTNAAVRALMTSYAGVSWSATYGVPLSSITGPVGQDLMRRLAAQCVTLDGFRLRTKIGLARMTYALRNVDLAALPRWGALMRRNSVQPEPLGVPLFVAQGSADVIISPAVTRTFVVKMCHAGQKVRFVEVPGGDHVTIARRTSDQTIAWLGDRFAGKPVPDDCSNIR